MKNLSILLLLAATLTGLSATQVTASPQSAYAQAVKSYVDAAAGEIAAIRSSVDAEVKAALESRKNHFEAVYKKLDRCDRLIADLKASDPSTFDKIKLEFEKTRAEANKALADALADARTS